MIISFSRQNRSSARYFVEVFEEHDLIDNAICTCDDTFSLVSLASAGPSIGFVPERTQDLPNPASSSRTRRASTSRSGSVSPGIGRIRPPRVTT